MPKYPKFLAFLFALSISTQVTEASGIFKYLGKCLIPLKSVNPEKKPEQKVDEPTTTRRKTSSLAARPVNHQTLKIRNPSELIQKWRENLDLIVRARLPLFKKELQIDISDEIAIETLRKVYEFIFQNIHNYSGLKISMAQLKSLNVLLGAPLPDHEWGAVGIARGSIGINRRSGSRSNLIDREISGRVPSNQVVPLTAKWVGEVDSLGSTSPLSLTVGAYKQFLHIHPFIKFPETMARICLDLSMFYAKFPPILEDIDLPESDSANWEAKILHTLSN